MYKLGHGQTVKALGCPVLEGREAAKIWEP